MTYLEYTVVVVVVFSPQLRFFLPLSPAVLASLISFPCHFLMELGGVGEKKKQQQIFAAVANGLVSLTPRL